MFIGAELEDLLSSLPPRSSAVVALVERGCGEAVINAVDRYDAEVRRFGVQLDLTDELHSGRDWPLEGGTVR